MAATTPRPIPTYWLRATEAASYARVQKRTLMQAHRFGHLRAHRVSNRVVFTRRDIDDWIRGGGSTLPPKPETALIAALEAAGVTTAR